MAYNEHVKVRMMLLGIDMHSFTINNAAAGQPQTRSALPSQL